MKEIKTKVAIIGAGSSGLGAYREVSRCTDDFLMIQDGPLGTTCARVGCMPSKVLIQVGLDYHRRKKIAEFGIRGTEQLSIDIPQAMRHVRGLRDRFVSGVLKMTDEMGDQLIHGRAHFVEPGVLEVRGEKGPVHVVAEKIIVATGSTPIVPQAWRDQFDYRVTTTDQFFELESLPQRIAVVGTGVIGLEIGQALGHMDIDLFALGSNQFVGGLSDPSVNQVALEILREDMRIYTGHAAELGPSGNSIEVRAGDEHFEVDQVIAAMGRRPNLSDLQFSNAGIATNEQGLPEFDPTTMQIKGHPVFIAGDVNLYRPILHEASDEGRIAGYNACREKPEPFRRRTRMAITFTHPNIAIAGLPFAELQNHDLAIGEVRFEGQGRSLCMAENHGILRVYGDKKTAKVLGAEMVAPRGEHMAHLLAWSIEQKLDVHQLLHMPFYHPVVEEGLRTALRDLASQLEDRLKPSPLETLRCQGHAVPCFN